MNVKGWEDISGVSFDYGTDVASRETVQARMRTLPLAQWLFPCPYLSVSAPLGPTPWGSVLYELAEHSSKAAKLIRAKSGSTSAFTYAAITLRQEPASPAPRMSTE